MEGDSIPVYMDYTDSRGKVHKIVKGYNTEQCARYKEELAKGLKADGYILHILHMPYSPRPNWQIEAAMEMIELPYHCEEEAEYRVKEMEFQIAMEKTKKQTDPERRYLITLIIALVIFIIITVLR